MRDDMHVLSAYSYDTITRRGYIAVVFVTSLRRHVTYRADNADRDGVAWRSGGDRRQAGRASTARKPIFSRPSGLWRRREGWKCCGASLPPQGRRAAARHHPAVCLMTRAASQTSDTSATLRNLRIILSVLLSSHLRRYISTDPPECRRLN